MESIHSTGPNCMVYVSPHIIVRASCYAVDTICRCFFFLLQLIAALLSPEMPLDSKFMKFMTKTGKEIVVGISHGGCSHPIAN